MNNFEFAKHVETPEEIKQYLSDFFNEDGVDGLIDALGHIAKKQGMTKIAKKAGVNRHNLYRTLKKGSRPDFRTVNKVIGALDCKLEIR